MSDRSSRKQQLLKIKNGKGVQYILDEAYRILGNPILIHDMDYKIIAFTENPVKDDPIWNELTTTGMIGLDRQLFYKEEGFFELCADAKKITFLPSDKLQYDRIFGKLFTENNIQVGCACIHAFCKPFESDMPELFEMLCDILDHEFGQSDFYSNYALSYMDALVGRLIEGGIEDKYLYTAHIESLYTGLKPNLYLAVADITQCDPAYGRLEYFREVFKRIRPAFKYVIYSNYIVIMMSFDDKTFHVHQELRQLCQSFEQHNIYAGISNRFENIFELPQRYDDAVNALNDGLKYNSCQRIFLHGDIPALPLDE